ncbi:LOW QUALITY PROTEIN: hypothetical protein U9M48_002527 [Paspalum notatum var. saurae]|uniref:Uncharacterized protein n=1 Tax=Paspalum notatum var. saurae TaxID=547442 RepID=A0AAQ3SJ49_PASNO
MDLVTGALGVLLPNLAELLKDEYNLHKNVKKDIDYLYKELASMKAALHVVGEVPPEQLEDPVKIWAREVREMSFDMEAIVDTFLVEVQRSEPHIKGITRRFINWMTEKVNKAWACHGIGQEIKDMKERVKEVAERRDRSAKTPQEHPFSAIYVSEFFSSNRYKVDAITPATGTLVDPRITALLYARPTDLVGIDESREELVMRLTKEEDGTSAEQMIVSIVGFGGLGKTTLSKVVYDKLKEQFDCTGFVSVSQNPDITRIFKDILYELDNIEYMSLEFLCPHLLNTNTCGVYLIVVDDLWDTKQWEIVRCALLENGMKSRIITTTQRYDVAQHAGEGNCPQQFSDVSEKILNKCGGVPLAIVTISSLLANKSRSVKDWYDVCDSIGSGLGKNPGIDSMRKILLLSYYDLTPHLKTYYEIAKDRLIWRWIAEGFITNGEGSKAYMRLDRVTSMSSSTEA